MNKKLRLLALLFFFTFAVYSQVPVTLYEQFNGRYDFTFVGNTLNPQENTFQIFPNLLTQSQASVSLNSDDTLLKAYLYWAGSGTGDFEVMLNGTPIVSERNFALFQNKFVHSIVVLYQPHLFYSDCCYSPQMQTLHLKTVQAP